MKTSSFIRLLPAILAFLIAVPGFAASIADRSPFAQGLWWNSARSGDGFQIFNSAEQAMVIWYTYDDAGRPIWYTAQGEVASVGTTWPLMKDRWVNGRKVEPTQVGTLRLDVHHPEGADLIWQINGKQGTWPIRPFIVSGVVNEVDHTGVWFDPAHSGWGVSTLDQGDVIGAVLYTYDAAGAPTWVAGFERNRGSVELFATTGACTACTYTAPSYHSVGRLALDFRGEMELVMSSTLTLPIAAGASIDGTRLLTLSRPASWRPADRQLASFTSETALKAYLDAGMLSVPPMAGGVDFSPAPPQIAYSPTNLQESGVDEADLVKSDGRHVYTYAVDSFGHRQPIIRVAQVAGDGATLEVRGTVALQSGPNTQTTVGGLYLDGENLVSVTGSQPYVYAGSPWDAIGAWTRGVTNIEVLSTVNPDLPVTRWRAEIAGYHVTSRRIGQRIYIVSRYVPFLPMFTYGATSAAAVAANQRLVSATSLLDLMPKTSINGGSPAVPITPADVYAPPQGSRKPIASMILVTAIDVPTDDFSSKIPPRIAQTLAIIGSVDAVYASTTSLFVATARHDLRDATGALLPVEPSFYLTDIHQIRLGADAMSIVGSASIEGFLGADPEKSSFRLSEYQGQLRAVTSTSTNGTMWLPGHKNRLTILQPSTVAPGLLKTVSFLPNAQRPQTLGKPNELLYGTRFLGDRLYAVTFKKVDPLYIVDLADSTDPRISGAVELPGFSDYLHPLPNGLLLGFGKDARPADVMGDAQFAWYQGLQLTLFDVSNASEPREIQRVLMGKRGSDSALLRDHHAFSALMRSDGSAALAFPASIHDGFPSYNSGDSTYYPWQESGLMRFELSAGGASSARLYQAPSLITDRATLQPNQYLYGDPGVEGGRSVLFTNGTIFIGRGQFWRQDSAGNVFGPY